uniref:Peptidase S1 domain-containing protein n=1 Tax=Panagrolaimus superbus TaxID=310955 RepID=A0A914YYY2_9BILA
MGHFIPAPFQQIPSEMCTEHFQKHGETFNGEQQSCGKGASPFINMELEEEEEEANKLNIFGSPCSAVASDIAANIDDEEIQYFISNKNHKMILLEDLQIEINPRKDVSFWHDIAFVLSESLNFDANERAKLNKNATFHSKDLQIIEQISESEIAWSKYDLYPEKVCARAFSDIHCCEFGSEQQICGPKHSERLPSTPLFDDRGKFVGIFSTENLYDHGQSVDVFTRIDANLEWIKSYF